MTETAILVTLYIGTGLRFEGWQQVWYVLLAGSMQVGHSLDILDAVLAGLANQICRSNHPDSSQTVSMCALKYQEHQLSSLQLHGLGDGFHRLLHIGFSAWLSPDGTPGNADKSGEPRWHQQQVNPTLPIIFMREKRSISLVSLQSRVTGRSPRLWLNSQWTYVTA